MGEESLAERLDGLLDTVSQCIKRPSALLLGGLVPFLQPALFRLVGLDPGLVAEQPEQHEVGVDLALHQWLRGRTRRTLPE